MTPATARPLRNCAIFALLVSWSVTLACDRGQAPADDVAKAEKTAVASETPRPPTEPAPPDVSAPDTPCPKGSTLIPDGKFFMGSDSEEAILGRARPAHQVDVAAVCLAIHEVTVAEYKTCVGAGDCKPAFRETWWPQGTRDEDAWNQDRQAHTPICNDGHTDRLNHPINCVTWAQADAYCRHKNGRLPTEAEWEFAARGSDGRVYPWGDQLPDPERANVCDQRCAKWREEHGLRDFGQMFDADDGYAGTSPVGSYPKGRTQGGLEDIVGNVYEWTSDRYYKYTATPQTNPTGPETGDERVIRGGAFNSFRAEFADPAFRHAMHENAHSHGIGFRCAFDPKGT